MVEGNHDTIQVDETRISGQSPRTRSSPFDVDHDLSTGNHCKRAALPERLETSKSCMESDELKPCFGSRSGCKCCMQFLPRWNASFPLQSLPRFTFHNGGRDQAGSRHHLATRHRPSHNWTPISGPEFCPVWTSSTPAPLHIIHRAAASPLQPTPRPRLDRPSTAPR